MRAETEAGYLLGIYHYYHFRILVCGDENYTLTNTTELSLKWPRVEEGKTFKIPFSEYQGWFEIELQGLHERQCESPYELRDENCTSAFKHPSI